MLLRRISIISIVMWVAGSGAIAQSIDQLAVLPAAGCTNFNASNRYGERPDPSGCTFVERARWLSDDNFQDEVRLSEVEQDAIQWLTYHHQGFRDQQYASLLCDSQDQPSGCLNESEIRNRLNAYLNGRGIVPVMWGMHSHHTGAQNRWGEIAYHYVVDTNGNVAEGRPLKYSAHSGTAGDDTLMDSFGEHYYPNHLAVVLAGNYDYQNLEEPALMGMARVLSAAQVEFRLGSDRIGSHRSRGSTSTCPGDHIGEAEHELIVLATTTLTVQTELEARGCRPGEVDGYFGSSSKEALRRLNRRSNIFGNGDDLVSTWEALISSDETCK